MKFSIILSAKNLFGKYSYFLPAANAGVCGLLLVAAAANHHKRLTNSFQETPKARTRRCSKVLQNLLGL
jgi:hypothetical protein